MDAKFSLLGVKYKESFLKNIKFSFFLFLNFFDVLCENSIGILFNDKTISISVRAIKKSIK